MFTINLSMLLVSIFLTSLQTATDSCFSHLDSKGTVYPNNLTFTTGEDSLLGYALGEGDYTEVVLLLESGASPNDAGSGDMTALHVLAMDNKETWTVESSIKLAQLFIDHDIDTQQKDRDGDTALIVALDEGFWELAEFLLPFDPQYNKSDLLMYQSIANKDLILLKAALSQPINPNAYYQVNKENHLYRAIKNKWARGAYELLNSRYATYWLNKGAINKETVLFLIVTDENQDLLTNALNKGGDIDHRDMNGNTPLLYYIAHEHSNIEFLETMINHGAKLDIINNYNHWPLLLSCYLKSNHVIELLLEMGADPNFHAGRGCTALLYAVKNDLVEIAAVLLAYGADPHLESRQGESPCQLVLSGSNQEMLDVFRAQLGAHLEEHSCP